MLRITDPVIGIQTFPSGGDLNRLFCNAIHLHRVEERIKSRNGEMERIAEMQMMWQWLIENCTQAKDLLKPIRTLEYALISKEMEPLEANEEIRNIGALRDQITIDLGKICLNELFKKSKCFQKLRCGKFNQKLSLERDSYMNGSPVPIGDFQLIENLKTEFEIFMNGIIDYDQHQAQIRAAEANNFEKECQQTHQLIVQNIPENQIQRHIACCDTNIRIHNAAYEILTNGSINRTEVYLEDVPQKFRNKIELIEQTNHEIYLSSIQLFEAKLNDLKAERNYVRCTNEMAVVQLAINKFNELQYFLKPVNHLINEMKQWLIKHLLSSLKSKDYRRAMKFCQRYYHYAELSLDTLAIISI